MPSNELLYARAKGQVPDRYWYALNGKSAQENFAEIMNERSRKSREAMMERYNAQHQKKETEDDEPLNIVIEGKVKK